MPLCPSGHHYYGHGLVLLAMAASLSSTLVISKDSRFTWADCQTSAVSSPPPASSPLSSSSSSINSTFWSNVVTLLAALLSAAAPTGFVSLSHGNGTDRAFVRGMCRGDSTLANCAKHLLNAAVAIQSRCNSSRRAAIWYDDGSTVTYPAPMFYFVSYADTNASTSYEDGYRQELQNRGQVFDKNAFESTYSALMTRLAERVVNGTAGAAPSPAPMFALSAC